MRAELQGLEKGLELCHELDRCLEEEEEEKEKRKRTAVIHLGS